MNPNHNGLETCSSNRLLLGFLSLPCAKDTALGVTPIFLSHPMLIHQHFLKTPVLSPRQSQLKSSCFLSRHCIPCHFIVCGLTTFVFLKRNSYYITSRSYGPTYSHGRNRISLTQVLCSRRHGLTFFSNLMSYHCALFLSLTYTELSLLGKNFSCCVFYLKGL